MTMQRLHLRIEGRVQGVSFRWSAERQARQHGLVGWVRNRPDGSVEAVAEGPAAALGELLAWARRGPPGAEVTRVMDRWGEASGEYSEFEIRH